MTDDVRRVPSPGTGTTVTAPGPVFAAAVDTGMAGQRLDMRSLALRLVHRTPVAAGLREP